MSAVLRRPGPRAKRRKAFVPDAMFRALGTRIDSADIADDSKLLADSYAAAGATGLEGDARTIAALESVQRHYLDQAQRWRMRANDRLDWDLVNRAMSRSYDMRAALRNLLGGVPS